jgi:hypothetical protein
MGRRRLRGVRQEPTSGPWSYGLVNLIIYAVGFGMVTLGHKIGAKRREKSSTTVELAR